MGFLHRQRLIRTGVLKSVFSQCHMQPRYHMGGFVSSTLHNTDMFATYSISCVISLHIGNV